MFRKTYFAIKNHTDAEIDLALETTKDHPRSGVGQGRGIGRAVVKATGETVRILQRCNCEGGNFADGTFPGETCPLLSNETADGICPLECAPFDQQYMLTLLAALNGGSVEIDDVTIYHRAELESVKGQE